MMESIEILVQGRKACVPIFQAHVLLDGLYIGKTDKNGRVYVSSFGKFPKSEFHYLLVSQEPRYKPCYQKFHAAVLEESAPIVNVFMDEYRPPPRGGLGWGMLAIEAPVAYSLGTSNVRVGVLDVGIQRDHPCLNIRGGFVASSRSETPHDFHKPILPHGTFCAGLIGGYRSENRGILGTMPGVELYDIRVFDAEGVDASSSAIVAGVEWAIKNEIRVLNLGIGSPYPQEEEAKAYERAWEAGIVLVAPAGNSDCASSDVMYPAQYPYTIAVTAIGRVEDAKDHEKALISRDGRYFFPDFNCCGEQVDLAAPGVEICSILPTTLNNRVNYDYCFGTSEAACFATGAAAIVLATCPELTREHGWRTPEAVRRILCETAVPLGFSPGMAGTGLVCVSNILKSSS